MNYDFSFYDENSDEFSQSQINTIRMISKVCSFISMISSIVTFIIFWFFKENRSFKLELVLWYSLSNFLYSVTAFFPFNPINEPTWCELQSLFLTWFQEASQLWTCIIGYVAFISVIKKNHIENNKSKYRVGFVMVAFLVSGCLASMLVNFFKSIF
jgi:hypothetical protein